MTALKNTISSRFDKLEKTVAKIHNEFKLKLFDGIVDNVDGFPDQKAGVNASLTLDFGKEKGTDKKKGEDGEPGGWNDVNMRDSSIMILVVPRVTSRTPKNRGE